MSPSSSSSRLVRSRQGQCSRCDRTGPVRRWNRGQRFVCLECVEEYREAMSVLMRWFWQQLRRGGVSDAARS
jgi:hypothetical protein